MYHLLSPTIHYSHSYIDVLFGFLGFEFPQHIALSCPDLIAFDTLFNLGSLLLDTAKVVHKLLLLLPHELIESMEKEEFLWEPSSKLCWISVYRYG